jgi:hypothetical protein
MAGHGDGSPRHTLGICLAYVFPCGLTLDDILRSLLSHRDTRLDAECLHGKLLKRSAKDTQRYAKGRPASPREEAGYFCSLHSPAPCPVWVVRSLLKFVGEDRPYSLEGSAYSGSHGTAGECTDRAGYSRAGGSAGDTIGKRRGTLP